MQIKLHHAAGLALLTAIISGTSNFMAKIAVTAVKDPVVFTFLKNALVAVLLLGILLFATRFRELKTMHRRDWVKLIAIAVVGGSIPFVLFFTGLTMTSALSAGVIHKSLFIWVALLAIPFLKERIGGLQAAALLLLVAGNAVLGGFSAFHFGRGELLILAATLLWAVENIIAKKALANLSSLTVAGARMILGSVVLLAVVAFQGKLNLFAGLAPAQWGWTLFTAALLLGYVLTWYTALKHAPATMVASLLVPATLVTNVLSLVFLDRRMTPMELASGSLFVLAAVLLIWQARRLARQHAYVRTNDARA